jgi:hypothetical protein
MNKPKRKENNWNINIPKINSLDEINLSGDKNLAKKLEFKENEIAIIKNPNIFMNLFKDIK